MILKKQATGKLNTDASHSVIPAGDFTNAENVRLLSTRAGRLTEVQNVEGNRLVSYSPVDGRFQHECIGVHEDRANNRLYYFLWGFDLNQNRNKHKILCYDATSDSVIKLVHDDEINGSLNFQRDSWVQSSYTGGVLYFTDDFNGPRKIEVDKIIDGSYIVQDIEELDLGAKPGKLPLLTRKVNSIAEGIKFIEPIINNMKDNAFQFSYRYLYEDNSVSVLATYSDIVNYDDDDAVVDTDAAILTLPINEVIPNRVKKVQLCVRQGNSGSWFIVDEAEGNDIVSHNLGSPITFNFFNDRTGIALPDEYSSKSFDLIPRRAKALDIAKDRLFLGNIFVGYETPSVSRFAAAAIQLPTETNVTITCRVFACTYSCENPNTVGEGPFYNHHFVVEINEGEDYDGFYLIPQQGANILSLDQDYIDGVEPPDQILLSPNEFLANLSFGNDTDFMANACADKHTQIFGTQFSNIDDTEFYFFDPFLIDVYSFGLGGFIEGTGPQGRHFKPGGRYKIGIAFYDKYDQTAGVHANKETVVDVPKRLYLDWEYTPEIRWNMAGINSEIPVWATHYRILRTKNLLVDSFFQSPIIEVKYGKQEDDGTYTFNTTFQQDFDVLAISLEPIEKEGLGYIYREGDAVQLFLANESRFDLNIIGQVGKYLLIDLSQDVESYLTAIASTQFGIKGIMEVYTPYQGSSDDEFYEVGESYKIVNPGTPQRAYSVTQGELKGDIYTKARALFHDYSFPDQDFINIEVMSINDRKWQTWVQGIGRRNTIIRDGGEREYPNRAVYSNTFIQSTNVNGLSSFDLLDRFDTDERTGDIYAMKYTSSTNNSENVLLVIGSNNTSSVYIGQTRVIDDAGAAILATSGSVIGTINVLRGDYGTVNPESVVLAKAGRVFFYDKNSNSIVRYSSNGLFPVSEYGVNSIMPTIARPGKFPAGFDGRHDEYMLRAKTGNVTFYPSLDDYRSFVTGILFYEDKDDVREAPEGVILNEVDSFPETDVLATLSPLYQYEVVVSQSETDTDILLDSQYETTITGNGNYILTVEEETELSVVARGLTLVLLYKSRIDPHQFVSDTEKVLCYHDTEEGFIGSRLFAPEAMSPVNDNFVSFLNGSIYVHDTKVYNNFYGEQTSTLIAFVYNDPNPYVKVPRGVSVEGDRPPDEVHFRINERYVQSSDIVADEFRRNETVWYADVKRDRLTPGFDEFEKALFHGETLRGQNILVFFKWDGSKPINARVMNLRIQASDGHPIVNQ